MTFVENINGKPKISTLTVAKGMEVSHKAILQSITKYRKDFDDLGTLDGDRLKSQGRPTAFFWINEEHTIFVCSLMKNIGKVIKFKKQVAVDFVAMRNTLFEIKNRQKNASWIEARNNGKISRRDETDIIKEFVEYATSQGSKNANMYYSNLTRMENKSLFIIEQKFKNIRELLDGQQLAILSTCDQAVAKSLRDGMKEGMHYKEIYQKAKQDVLSLVKLLGQTYVPNQKKLETK